MGGTLVTPGQPEPTKPWELYSRMLRLRLDAYWKNPYTDGIKNRMPWRIAETAYRQPVPVGISNPYWELVSQLPCDSSEYERFMGYGFGLAPNTYLFPPGGGVHMFSDRFELCPIFSWSIPSPGDMEWMYNLLGGQGLVEIGAGTGYWLWQLQQYGVDGIGYDLKPGSNRFAWHTWTDVRRGGPSRARNHSDRALFLCWPPYDTPMAADTLKVYKGDLLFYAGEGEGGCTADNEFFKILERDWEEISTSKRHISFWGIHCYLTARRRKT